MSNWTHVAGVIRLDAIRIGDIPDPDFDLLFGKECLFESPYEVWEDTEAHPEKYLPMGSEGSLQKNVWINPEKSHIAAYTVSIFGDLRDHDSAQEIVDWFKEICRRIDKPMSGEELPHCFIRQAVITADNEIAGSASWSYDGAE